MDSTDSGHTPPTSPEPLHESSTDITPDPSSYQEEGAAASTLHPFWRIVLYTVAVLMGGAAGLVLAAISVMGIKTLMSGGAVDASSDMLSADMLIASMVGAYFAATVITLLFARYVDGRTLGSLGFRGTGWVGNLAKGTALGVGFVLVMFGTYATLGWVSFHPDAAVNWNLYALSTVLFYPIVGVTEEVVFRGYLLKNLEEWKGRTFALVITSILFWLIHLDQGNAAGPIGAPTFLAMAMAFALFRYATGSLWFPIGLHAAYDWISITLGGSLPDVDIPAPSSMEVHASTWLVGPVGYTGIADLTFTLLLLGLAILSYRQSRHRLLPGQSP